VLTRNVTSCLLRGHKLGRGFPLLSLLSAAVEAESLTDVSLEVPETASGLEQIAVFG
jgi:hypothetical protein